jgi:hypothetical protein
VATHSNQKVIKRYYIWNKQQIQYEITKTGRYSGCVQQRFFIYIKFLLTSLGKSWIFERCKQNSEFENKTMKSAKIWAATQSYSCISHSGSIRRDSLYIHCIETACTEYIEKNSSCLALKINFQYSTVDIKSKIRKNRVAQKWVIFYGVGRGNCCNCWVFLIFFERSITFVWNVQRWKWKKLLFRERWW